MRALSPQPRPVPVVDADLPGGFGTLRRALVVEDAAPIRRRLMEVLRFVAPGLEAVEAATPEAAADAFRRHRPQVVFAELVGEDPAAGLAMMRWMLQADLDVRIVLLTAYEAGSWPVREALRLGVFAVVHKPLRHDLVRHALHDVEAEAGAIERMR